jgi:hypothetical protein
MSSSEHRQSLPAPTQRWAATSAELAALDFSQNILDRRFALESWLDSRSNWLLSIQSILVGAVLLFATKSKLDGLAAILVAASLLAFAIGLGFSLYRSVPKFRSRRQIAGQGGFDPRNPRTTLGIETFGAEEYRALLCSLTVSEMIACNADQIRQVNAIVMEELRISVIPVIATAVGILVATCAVVAQLCS